MRLSHVQDSDSSTVAIDAAGATQGGAARFLRELQGYLSEAGDSKVRLLGLNRQLTASWLVQREFIAAPCARKISLNNSGFISPSGEKITLLRNILQFAETSDFDRLGYAPPRRLRAQIPVIRALARASDVLVVPCSRMADQVGTISPNLRSRIVVRFHPVSVPAWAGSSPGNSPDILMPIVPSPYKNLDQHVEEFLIATEAVSSVVRLVIPANEDSLPELAPHPRLKFIGQQSSWELDSWWQRCRAVYFPVEFESFGYALAEARVYGRFVIAQDSNQNREIAGGALKSYRRGDASSLRDAIVCALESTPAPEPSPFHPKSYFDWLIDEISSESI